MGSYRIREVPALEHCTDPGILLVLSRPTSPRHLKDFHEWYNTEHGPARLKLGKDYFLNGYRYKATDDEDTWLAIYDMQRLSAACDKTYTILREKRSSREQEVFRFKVQVLSRQFLRLVDNSRNMQRPAAAICVVIFEIGKDNVLLKEGWYSKVFDMISAQHNCIRSRLFQLVDGTGKPGDRGSFLAICDFEKALEVDAQEGLHRDVEKVLTRHGVVMAGLRTFDYRHEFLASDYRAPPEQ